MHRKDTRIPRTVELFLQVLPPQPLLGLAFAVAQPPEHEIGDCDENECCHEADHDADFVRGTWTWVVWPRGFVGILDHGGKGEVNDEAEIEGGDEPKDRCVVLFRSD